jgi:thermolabile hemolysin
MNIGQLGSFKVVTFVYRYSTHLSSRKLSMTFKQIQVFFGSLVVCIQMAVCCRAEVQVFGDSLSDTGNFSAVYWNLQGEVFPPSPLYANGRFSNGPVWVDYLAESLGELAPTPALLGGTNYAFNGARAAGASPYGSPDLVTQVDIYLAANNGVADSEDIYVVWAGANDIFFRSSPADTSSISNAVRGISLAIGKLHGAGARAFVVPDLPMLGQTPFFSSNANAAADLDRATVLFNSLLSGELRRMRVEHRTSCIVEVKVSGLFKAITQNPKRFDLDNVTASATLFDPFGIGYALPPAVDPNRFLFWDSIHPTTKGHKLIADHARFWIGVYCKN